MKKYKIELPIYYGKITVYIDNEIELIGEKIGVDISEHVECFCYRKEPHNYIIGLKENIFYYNIVHEVVHLVNFIYEDHHIKLSKSNDEPQAYLTGYLFDEIFKKL